MQSAVPQYIDVEDKIVGPFTWKHLGWLFAMGTTLLLFYSMFDFQLFLLAGVPTAFVFLAFAFYKPNGMPMTAFVFHGIFFLFRPKISVWERPIHVTGPPKVVTENPNATNQSAQEQKSIDEEKLKALAAILDRRR